MEQPGLAVTLIEALDRLIAREEPFAGEQVAAALRDEGRGHPHRGEGHRRSRGGRPGDRRPRAGDPIAATSCSWPSAAGRSPRTSVSTRSGWSLEAPIEVDDRLRAGGSEWLFAIGDVNGRVAAHGQYQGRIAADVILGKDARLTQDGSRSPRVIFTDPQVAAVGYTLAAAQAGLNVRAVDVGTQANAGASFYGRDTVGTTRLVVDEERKILAGATFSGPEIADFLHAATVAVVGEVPLARLWHAVPSFPTRSEVWLKLLERYGL